jgi:hypothetical protein
MIGLDAFRAALIGLGGNMLLPARGGDFLRCWYSHRKTSIALSVILSRLIVEKAIDLLIIFFIGLVASAVFYNADFFQYIFIVSALGFTLVLSLLAVAMTAGPQALSWVEFILTTARIPTAARQKILQTCGDITKNLSVADAAVPSFLTLAMWLSLYASAYILIAKMVGISLTYSEALVVMFAGALGLMVPAAPSGIGTFHASVVSAFVMLGRSSSEGLILGTAIHFLFLIAYVVPMLAVGGQWRNMSQSQVDK